MLKNFCKIGTKTLLLVFLAIKPHKIPALNIAKFVHHNNLEHHKTGISKFLENRKLNVFLKILSKNIYHNMEKIMDAGTRYLNLDKNIIKNLNTIHNINKPQLKILQKVLKILEIVNFWLKQQNLNNNGNTINNNTYITIKQKLTNIFSVLNANFQIRINNNTHGFFSQKTLSFLIKTLRLLRLSLERSYKNKVNEIFKNISIKQGMNTIEWQKILQQIHRNSIPNSFTTKKNQKITQLKLQYYEEKKNYLQEQLKTALSNLKQIPSINIANVIKNEIKTNMDYSDTLKYIALLTKIFIYIKELNLEDNLENINIKL